MVGRTYWPSQAVVTTLFSSTFFSMFRISYRPAFASPTARLEPERPVYPTASRA